MNGHQIIGRMRRASASPGRRQRGFSMIEVLIALVVLAIGLLGFALLQTMNLRYTQSANYRTQATNLAYDLLDQMRANRLSAAQYSNATFAVGAVSGANAANCSRPVGSNIPITGAGSANSVIGRWQCQVIEALGNQASATVTYNNGEAVVTLNWGERMRFTAPLDASSTQFTVRTRL